MSLQHLLTRLILLCVCPLILLSIFLAALSVLSKQDQRNSEAANLAKNFAVAVDQHLQARISALHMLAQSSLVDDSAKWKDFYREAQGFRQGFGSHVILADPQMHMLVNTRAPFGARLPSLPSSKGRAAAPTALETGKPAVGDIVFGPVAREPLVAIAVPAVREGKVVYLLLTTMETRQFQSRLEQVSLPAGWSLSLLDGNAAAIAGRIPPGINTKTDVDASGRFVVKSNLSSWSVVVEIPRSLYRQSLIEAAAALAVVIFCAALISLLGGLLVSRRLAKAVKSLAEPSTAGTPLPDIAEIAAARRLLDDAAEKQKSAGARLKESEERYRSFFTYSNDAVLLTAPDGRILQANPEACRIFGRTEDEICALGRAGLVDPSDPRVGPAFEERDRTGRFKGELNMLRRDGTSFPAEISSAVFADQNGNLRTSVIIRDMTEHRQALEKLAKSEERIRFALETSRIGAWDLDLVDHTALRTPLHDRIFGYADLLPEWTYERFLDHVHPEDRKRVDDAFQHAVATGQDWEFVCRIFRKDGQVRWIWAAGRHSLDDAGALRRMAGIVQDITDKKQAEEEILRLNDRLRYLIEVIQRLSSTQSLEEIAEAVRTGARRLVGADGATFILRDNGECLYMDEDAITPLWKGRRFPLAHCISGWAMLHRETVIIEDIFQDDRIPHDLYEKTFVKSVTIVPVRFADPYGAIGLYWGRKTRPGDDELLLIRTLANATSIAMENVRAYRELEMRVRERTAELAEANLRLQELDRLKSMFIASMSHELRTPLNSIIGFTGIILMGMSGEISPVQRKQLGMVRNSAKHLLDLINDVIDVSKIEAGKTELIIEPFDLAELALDVKDSFAVAAADKGLCLEWSADGKADVSSDRRRVRQILMNLVGNAVKFTEKGTVEIALLKAAGGFRMSVRDTGVGVEPSDMEKLFQAFSRIHIQGRPVVEGTGLGLYLSRRIAQLLGGEITAESEPGQGSRFTLFLPQHYPGVKT
ncbi:MAG: PAS domain S-box protein [Deltaproteobacteria bacterium]